MAEKKAKATPKKKEKDLSRPAQLHLRDSYGGVILNGKLTVTGKPDGVQFLGAGHRITGLTENQILLQRACEDAQEVKKKYLNNGWKE